MREHSCLTSIVQLQEYTSLVDKLESAITAVNENFIEKLG